MSVRRLADEAVQPTGFTFSNDNQTWAERKIAEYPPGRQQSAVIPLLMRAQEQEGWISRPAIESVAAMLSMPYIRVLEVATFYTMFQLKPVGTLAHVQVCGTTPCMLRGAEALREVCQHRINHEPFETNADGTMSWEEVECLGACVNAPMVMIGKDTYEDLTVERFEEILEAFAAGNGDSIRPGTQIGRVTSAAEGGATTLNEPPTAERTYKPFPPPEPLSPPEAKPEPKPEVKPAVKDDTDPTSPGRKREVSIEAAPAMKGPPRAEKVSQGEAESERLKGDAAAGATGEPNRAMREDAVGSEAEGGKRDEGASVGKEPRRLFEAPEGPADDLKMIRGVGPVMEGLLHTVGIRTWAQLARLSDDDIAALEAELNFKGRIGRDKWIEQAEALARGGVEEYRKVFGKEPL